MLIMVGETQNKIPTNLVQKTQPFGNSIEWLQIKSNRKKNALDFFIVYFLGNYISTKKNKEYIIYSKDKGYDPLIEYLKTQNINVKRIETFKQLGGKIFENEQKVLDEGLNENILERKEKLSNIEPNKRPIRKESLGNYIKNVIKKSNEEIEEIIKKMFIQKIIYEENGHIKYKIK
jgi:hypothetical protein